MEIRREHRKPVHGRILIVSNLKEVFGMKVEIVKN